MDTNSRPWAVQHPHTKVVHLFATREKAREFVEDISPSWVNSHVRDETASDIAHLNHAPFDIYWNGRQEDPRLYVTQAVWGEL